MPFNYSTAGSDVLVPQITTRMYYLTRAEYSAILKTVRFLVFILEQEPATILEEMREAGGDVLGIDWRIPIDVAWQRLGYDIAIQGNLDPAVLLADSDLVKTQTADVLKRVGNRPGHIFNLGHGILPETPQENVQHLVEFVHEQTKRG